MLQAMNAGHDGSMTTPHANAPAGVVRRLEVRVQQNADSNLPVESIHQQIASAVDLIVQLSVVHEQGQKRKVVSEITEVVGVALAEVLGRISTSLEELQRVQRKRETDTASGRLMVLLMAFFPAGFLLMLWFLDNSLLRNLFDTLAGQMVLSVVGLLTYISVRSPSLTANVLLQAAGGLEYLHGRKKGHGNVNTLTLLVSPGGDVKFGDFLGYDFGNYAPIPDPDLEARYQAPELLGLDMGGCGPSSDLYCLGYVCLELLAGDQFEKLFEVPEGINWLAWHANLGKRLEHWDQALRHVPRGLIDILNGLIAKPLAERAY